MQWIIFSSPESQMAGVGVLAENRIHVPIVNDVYGVPDHILTVFKEKNIAYMVIPSEKVAKTLVISGLSYTKK